MNLHFSNLAFAVTKAKKHSLSLCYLSIKHICFFHLVHIVMFITAFYFALTSKISLVPQSQNSFNNTSVRCYFAHQMYQILYLSYIVV